MSEVYIVHTDSDGDDLFTMFKLKDDESAEQVGKDIADGLGQILIEVMHVDDFIDGDDQYNVEAV